MAVRAAQIAVLIDSNIFIAAEDHGADGHVYGQDAAELLRLIGQLGYRLVLSHGTKSDVLAAPEPLRTRRRKALEKFEVLASVPASAQIREVFPPALSNNDAADLEVLTSFATGIAQWLVTQDARMRRRAAAAGIDNVISLINTLDMFRALTSAPTVTAPAVERVDAYRVDQAAPIFASLKADYDGFDQWWRHKVVAGRRDVLILGPATSPDGIAVLKTEHDQPLGLPDPVLKVCTFKIGDDFQGDKRGELLLKACVEYARNARLECLYMEVLPGKEELLAWLAAFGFADISRPVLPNAQRAMRKFLSARSGGAVSDTLGHAVAYGPGSIRLERAHVVPIRDHWHHRLLPEADDHPDLFQGQEGCGNAIRKAYLCRAGTRKVEPGDGLLFMRTEAGPSRITAVGVVEQTEVNANPEVIVAFVGSRTVYTQQEMQALCAEGDVLAILFRFDRVVAPPLPSERLLAAGVLNGPAQSITQISREGVEWVGNQLGV